MKYAKKGVIGIFSHKKDLQENPPEVRKLLIRKDAPTLGKGTGRNMRLEIDEKSICLRQEERDRKRPCLSSRPSRGRK